MPLRAVVGSEDQILTRMWMPALVDCKDPAQVLTHNTLHKLLLVLAHNSIQATKYRSGLNLLDLKAHLQMLIPNQLRVDFPITLVSLQLGHKPMLVLVLVDLMAQAQLLAHSHWIVHHL